MICGDAHDIYRRDAALAQPLSQKGCVLRIRGRGGVAGTSGVVGVGVAGANGKAPLKSRIGGGVLALVEKRVDASGVNVWVQRCAMRAGHAMHRPGVGEIRLGRKMARRVDVPVLGGDYLVVVAGVGALEGPDGRGYLVAASCSQGTAGAKVVLDIDDKERFVVGCRGCRGFYLCRDSHSRQLSRRLKLAVSQVWWAFRLQFRASSVLWGVVKTPIPFYLNQILNEVRDDKSGAVADYIPELADAEPDYLGAALCTTTGHVYSAGDAEQRFTIQSISKPFVYALALQEIGLDEVMKIVGLEPSGEAFNELSLHRDDNRPVNPMINAGAIAITQLINGVDSGVEERTERIRSYMSRLAGRELELDHQLCTSELETAERNLALAHMLRNYDIIQDSAHDAVLTYTQQCSLLVDVEDLAIMSATLANGGRQPVTDDKILDADVCRLTLALMSSAGMYDGAGRWMAEVGIPAKSGVAGGLLGTLPGQLGLATFSPRLNEQGNSVRGVEIFKHLSQDMGLHLMSTDERYGIHPVRALHEEDGATVVCLQGLINFNAAETILYQLEHEKISGESIVLDMSQVTAFNRVGRRMLKEGLRRFRESGLDIAVVDPDERLTDLKMSDGTEVPVHDAEDYEINGDPM